MVGVTEGLFLELSMDSSGEPTFADGSLLG
jgi:hypothetical protein